MVFVRPQGGIMKKWGVMIVLVCVWVWGGPVSAATMDPHLKWFTITTPHFKVNFTEKNEEPARKVAAYAEEAYDTISEKFHYHPRGKTQIVVTDHYDDANGLTTILPYKYINIRLASPDPEQSLQYYDNWLRTLVMHEYTHVVHLDQYGGIVTPLRYMFGSLISPNSTTPGWVREGIATLQETQTSTAGRGRAAYSDMLIRTAVLQKQFPKLDQVSGPGWAWPGAEGQYIFGEKFLEYIKDKYGEAKLAEFSERMSKNLLIYAVNIQAKRTWHKTFYTMWKEWQKEMTPKYEVEAKALRDAGLTELAPVTRLGEDVTITATAYSPDGKYLAYAMSSPHESATIKMLDLETGKHRIVKRKYVANQLSFSPDGETLYLSAPSLHKRYYLYRDLMAIDLKTDKLRKLTSGLRAQDPDVSPDGKSIVVATQDSGTKQLQIYDVEKKTIRALPIQAPAFTHYSHPRWSPDGKMIAVSVWREGSRDIYIYDATGKLARQLTNDNAIDGDVRWSPDGRTLYYSSDVSGISNIYAANVATGEQLKISNVITGVFAPTPIPGKSAMLVKYYTGKGYELTSFALPEVKWGKTAPRKKALSTADASVSPEESPIPDVPPLTLPQQKYSPVSRTLLLPHYISPFFTMLDNGVLFGAATGSSDVLNRHSWLATASYRTDAQHIGYSASYTYSRWRPQFSLGFMDYAVNLGYSPQFAVGGVVVGPFHIYENRRRAFISAVYPFNRQSVALAYSFEHRNSISQPGLPGPVDAFYNFGRFAGLTAAYVYSTVETTKASIGNERGRKVRAAFTVNSKWLGTLADNTQRLFQGDVRQFIPMPWLHHVIALRTAGGIAFGQQLVQGTYALGGALGEGALSAGGDSMYYFALRGLPVASFSRSRALVFSSEYRMPLIYAQRGLGTLPFYLSNLNLAMFADYGNAWNNSENMGGYWGFGNFMLGTGAELRADMVLGHGLPVTGRIGYGVLVVNRDRVNGMTDPMWGGAAKNGIFILQFGTSF